MWSAFLDESCDRANKVVYAIAAVFGDGWQVLKAEKLWKVMLAKHNLRVCRASSTWGRPQIAAYFAKVICDSGMAACGNIAEQTDVIDALEGSALHRQYRASPYMLLYQQTFINIAMDLRKGGSKDYVSFVCDENARYKNILIKAFEELRMLCGLSAPYIGSCSTARDEACIPLQMADLIAGELRIQVPDWMSGNAEVTPTLQTLIDGGVIWSVKHMDEPACKFVRKLIDERVESAKCNGLDRS